MNNIDSQKIKQDFINNFLEYIFTEYFTDVLSYTKTRWEQLPSKLKDKFKLSEDKIEEIIEYVKLNKTKEYIWCIHSEQFTNYCKKYVQKFNETNKQYSSENYDKLLNFCSDSYKKSQFDFFKATFCYEYVYIIFKKELENELQEVN